jgi:hypothetical protein
MLSTPPPPPSSVARKLLCRRFPKITPAKHDGATTNDPELSKLDIDAHKEELKNMQHKDPKNGGQPNNLSKHTDNVKSTSAMSGRQAIPTTPQKPTLVLSPDL